MLPMRIHALIAICAGLAAAQSIDPELAAHTALFARKIIKSRLTSSRRWDIRSGTRS